MVKELTDGETPKPAPIANLGELAAAKDPLNPREISDESAKGLAYSLEEFGDLSGITYNRQLGKLATGHQRVTQLHAIHGDLELQFDGDLCWFQTEAGERFNVRVVDWDESKHKAANVTANNPAIAGEYTDAVSEYVASIGDDSPRLFDNLLLGEIEGVVSELEEQVENGDDETPPEDPDDGVDKEIPALHALYVECKDEPDQQALFERLVKEGYKCKVVSM